MTTTTDDAPRIWVGCMGCYNAGALHGRWIDLDGLDADDLKAEIDKLGRDDEGRCTRTGSAYGLGICMSDEWWCYDTEGLPGGEMSPWEALEIAEWLAGHDCHRAAALLALDHCSTREDADAMLEDYHGKWDNLESYLRESDLFSYAHNPTASEWSDHRCVKLSDLKLGGHDLDDLIDWEKLTRWESHNYTVLDDPDGGVHIFG